MPGSAKLAALFFAIAIAVAIYFIGRELVPPEVVPANARPAAFSAARAFPYLEAVAREPHSSGEPAHARVRAYITGFCEEHGLETRVQTAVGFNRRDYRLVAGEAHNIIARLKGGTPGKAVLVAAHYDSQPNTPGAGDNGCAVASMMETIDLLAKGPALRNDVIFLFTDLEEPGQLGAEAFVNNYPGIDSIGIVLNFDARGNAGMNYIFETSGANSWIMKGLAAAVPGALGNSLACEVYKHMPNASDFTVFKNKGIPGWNTAFIEGYSNYHSMTDTPGNLDMRTLQHQGDLMLAAVRYFADLDITHAPDADAVFFNPSGSWLLVYSYTMDNILIAVTMLLFAALLTAAFLRQGLTVKWLLLGAAWFLLTILVFSGLIWLLSKWLFAAYPQYLNFSVGNTYNAKYYLLSLIGAGLLVFVIMYNLIARRWRSTGLFAGAMLVLLVMMLAAKFYIPSGAYMLYIPLIPVLSVTAWIYWFDIRFERRPYLYAAALVLQWWLPLTLWGVFAYLLYVVFSLSFPFAAAVFISLFIPLLILVKPVLDALSHRLLAVLAICLLLAGGIMAHIYAANTTQRPAATQLMYGVNTDAKEAVWVSTLRYKDDWLSRYIPAAAKSPFNEFYQDFDYYVWKNKAPYTAQQAASVNVIQDTLVNGDRQLKLLIVPGEGTNSLELLLTDKITAASVAARNIAHDPRTRLGRISFFAPPREGLQLECRVKGKDPARLLLIESRRGLPPHLLENRLPENMIFGPDYMSNCLQVKQTLIL
ncbi:Peptidase family M28 [Chitinophaga eiseniae]|uniref:Peptidase family M28 n=1 Tax=Chitinophaga eiseniae TaxID=634771 RepID=A0A1T4TYH0_9BACT|nr:M28 family peptidase [Chitinophaga eiseniae]SKA45470.1 Peptidase family M28 [Chitinophaga eiseniae]